MAGLAAIVLLAVAATGRTEAGENDVRVGANQPPVGAPPPAETAIPGDADGNKQQAAERRVFGHLLYRNRRQQVMLGRAVDDLADGRTTDGLIYLQALLDAAEDGFAWLGPQSRLVSVRALALRTLGSQPPDVLKAYERINRAEADNLLADAFRTGDPALFREVGRRFYYTSAGFAAMNWQAGRWLDQGNPVLAARVWTRLIADPAHQSRITQATLLKAALAVRLAGGRDESASILRRGDRREFYLGDGTKVDAGWLARRLPAAVIAARPVRRAVTPAADTAAGCNSRGSYWPTTPFLEPVWSRSYTAGPNELLDSLVGQWEQEQRENLRPVAVANSAVAAGDAIVVRDFGHIRAFDATTGQPRWSYRCATSLATVSRDALSRVASRSRSTSSVPVDVKDSFAGNATIGMLSTDGQRVFAVDYLDLSRKSRSSDRSSNSVEHAAGGSGGIVSRESNRLIALAVNPATEASLHKRGGIGGSSDGPLHPGSGEQRPIWSIGGAVDAPEWFLQMDRDTDGQIVQAEFTGAAGDFRRFDANEDSAIGLREAVAADGRSDRKNPLWGHFFLGPPLVVDGCLYVVTEADRQLNLVALRPETGELLWMQAIGFVEVPIDMDTARYPLHCTPSFADGILVCPTQVGLLVGVDAISGSLLWAYYYGDAKSLERLGRWPHRSLGSYGHVGFPAIAHIGGGRVVLLPRQSDEIHCIELQTGKPVWKAPREDAEYVGTIRDGFVLVVGSRDCRGLSLQTGDEIWSAALGMPSGRGLSSGTRYLVPLEAGRIATLEIATGGEIGFTLARADGWQVGLPRAARSDGGPPTPVDEREASTGGATWHPGNLIAVGDLVLSAGARRLVAFPQAAPLLATIERNLQEVQPTQAAAGPTIQSAELYLALGNNERARERLTAVLDEPMPGDSRERAEELLRELLYLELKHHGGDEELFEQLERLSTTPTRRGRYLMQRAEVQLRRGDFSGVLGWARELSALELSQPLPAVGDPSLLVTASSWIPSVIGRVQQRYGEAELADVLTQIDAEQQQALASADVARLERFLTVYSQWPQADAVRIELARRHIDARRFQQAELLLLVNRRRPDANTAANATAMLAKLWDRLGLWQEAAGLLEELDGRFADVPLDDGQTGRDFAASFAPDSLTAEARRQRRLPDWTVSRVEISERPWTEADPELSEVYGRYRRRFATEGETTFQLLVKGTSGDEKLAVIDRQTGRIVANIAVPSRVSYPSSGKTANVGHFLPLGSPGTMSGLSLLARGEAAPTWATRARQLASDREVLRVGPAGPSFCSFQARRHLIVVDPASGRILWQRTDLEPNCGLLNDPYAGLFGDDEALVLFSADRTSYTVFLTSTGEVVREGRLDVELNQQRRVFGRKLCYVARTQTGLRLRIWDPLHDRIELDEPINGRLYSTVTKEQELAVILPPGRLVVFDVERGEKRLDYALEPEQLANLNYLRLFSDRERYYINLQRAVETPPSRTYSYYASSTFLDFVHVQGELLAVNRQTGQLEWTRMLPQRTVIRTPHCQLPFLMMISGVRDRWNGNKQSLLVEAIDGDSGQTIGYKDNIHPDRIVGCSYQPRQSRILLHGLKTVVELRFDRPRQRLSGQDAPL